MREYTHRNLLEEDVRAGVGDIALGPVPEQWDGPVERLGFEELVVADEPTANLDSETAAKILDLLQRLNAETRITFVFATHDPALIARAPRCLRMRDGALVRQAIAA